jgi:hypothetical protein
MKLKTATLLAIIGSAVVIVWSIISFLHTLAGVGHVPLFYLLSTGPFLVFEICLLLFFVTLHRNQ